MNLTQMQQVEKWLGYYYPLSSEAGGKYLEAFN